MVNKFGENKTILILVGLIVLFIGLAVIIRIASSPRDVEETYYTPEPEPWIEENVLTEADDSIISVKRATRSQSELIDNKQEYITETGLETFFSHGFYEGDYFDTIFIAPEFYNQDIQTDALARQYTRMRISREMDPNDGVINGLMIAKLNANDMYDIYIFVDEDWRENLEYTNIVWGQDFTRKSSLQIRGFDFSKEKNGIYVNVVEDTNWKSLNPVLGGLIVGEVNLNTPESDQVNTTLMYIR